MKKLLRSHRELVVRQRAFAASMEIFTLTKTFPKEEVYSLTSQIRRSSRSVVTSITEAWRKRRYEPAFISTLNDAEAEAAETQDWPHYAVECGYLDRATARKLFRAYDAILNSLVGMINHADTWVFPVTPKLARTKNAQPRDPAPNQ